MKENTPETRYEKAVAQSKKLRQKDIEIQKVLSKIERHQSKIENRIKTNEIQKIDTGFIFSNGNTLSLVESLSQPNQKKSTLLEKFDRILKSITK